MKMTKNPLLTCIHKLEVRTVHNILIIISLIFCQYLAWLAVLSIGYGMKVRKSGFMPTATHQALQVHNVILTPGDRWCQG